jgi:surfeit locus 1 family protein
LNPIKWPSFALSWPKPFPIWACLATLLGVSILLSLGFWQLQRLTWKENLLQHLEQQKQADLKLQTASDLLELESDPPFQRLKIKGQFKNFQPQLLWQGQILDGQSAFHVLGFFEVADATKNKIWVPVLLGTATKIDQLDDLKRPDRNKRTITGYVRFLEPTAFTPQNPASDETGDETGKTPAFYPFYRYDSAFRSAVQNKLPPKAILSDFVFMPDDALTNLPHQAFAPKLNNNHLQYALFWFAMALILMLVFVGRFALKLKE